MIHSSLTPFAKRKTQNRWTKAEISNLIKIVSQVEPSDSKGWQQVFLKMQEHESQREVSSLIGKFLHCLEKKKGEELQSNPQISHQIMKNFSQGMSPQQISEKLTKISIFNVKKILRNILLRIQKVIAKVVGPNELKRLSMRDNFLYAYILKNGYKITNLPKIEVLCVHWIAIKRSNCEKRKQNPQFYEKTKKYIEKRLTIFNQHLKKYSIQFQNYIKDNANLVKQTKRKIRNIISHFQLSGVDESIDNLKQEKNHQKDQASLSESCMILQSFQDKRKNKKDEKIASNSILVQRVQSEVNYCRVQDYKMKREPLEKYLPYSHNFEEQRNIFEQISDEKNSLPFAFTLEDDYLLFGQQRGFFDLDSE